MVWLKIGDLSIIILLNFGKEAIQTHNSTMSKCKYLFCCLISSCCDPGKKSKFINNELYNENTINNIIKAKKVNDIKLQIERI